MGEKGFDEEKRKGLKGAFKDLPPALLWGLGICAAVGAAAGLVQLVLMLRFYGILAVALGAVFYILLCLLAAAAVTLLFAAVKRLRWQTFLALLFSVLSCAVLGMFSVFAMLLCILTLPTVWLLYRIRRGDFRGRRLPGKILRCGAAVVLTMCAAGILVLSVWPGPSLQEEDRPQTARSGLPLPVEHSVSEPLSNPAEVGSYGVRELYYAAADQKTEPYPGKTAILSGTADISGWLDGWSFLRSEYFGFGPQAVPLNGQVWMPEGEGPFPLALLVHGNHEAADRSDGGYRYLGDLLASRGIMAVSVDENFLNMSTWCDLLVFSPLQEENDARAVVLLEHLRQLQDWNEREDNSFYGKIDFEKLAVIGHSRGGEAAALAAAYSRLDVTPDNGMLELRYPFVIDTVVALSPTNDMYLPAGLELELRDVNYLVLHGAQDMDVSSFMGANLFRKADVGSGGRKAQVYIQHANHGQFNSDWGKTDVPGLMGGANYRNLLMSMEQQQQAAKVLVSAFLGSALQGETGYDALFESFAYGEQWLPPAVYTMDYISREHMVIDGFDSSFDLANAALPGVVYSAEGFSLWTQEFLPTRSAVTAVNSNRVLTLEWEKEAVFTVDFTGAKGTLKAEDTLYLSLCAGSGGADFSVRLTDERGTVSEMPASAFGGVPSPVHAPVYKWPLSALITDSEPVLQAMEIPIRLFEGLSGDIREAAFVFRSSETVQTVYIDDIRVRG